MEKKLEKTDKEIIKNGISKEFEGISLVKKNGNSNNGITPSIKPTNVEGHYPRFMVPGAMNLLQEDVRELSIILESFLPHIDKLGIQLKDTTPLIKEIITGSQIFRRLKGISQIELLPFAFKQVPWYTRYTHSCLTYVFGDHVLSKLASKLNFTDIELEAAKVCFLIHDLGHGPFSHLTERAFKKPRGRNGKIPKEYDHEYWTKILLNELKEQLFDTNQNPYLNKVVTKEEKEKLEVFSNAIKIISKDENSILSQLVSSQIDIDRLSNYLGDRIVVNAILEEIDVQKEKMVQYISSVSEVVDNIKRIMNAFVILNVDDKGQKCSPYLAIHEDAVNPIIHFLLDRHIIRYYLLKHHRRECANNLLEKILLRAQYLVRNNEIGALGKTDLLVQTWLFGNHTEAEFVKLDDQLVFNQIKKWSKYTNDPILQDLTLRFTAHKFFTSYSCEKDGKPYKPSQDLTEKVKNKINDEFNTDITLYSKELITEYYYLYDETTSKPYHTDREEITIYTSNKKIIKLSNYIKETKNELGEVLLNGEFERYLFVVPPEIEF